MSAMSRASAGRRPASSSSDRPSAWPRRFTSEGEAESELGGTTGAFIRPREEGSAIATSSRNRDLGPRYIAWPTPGARLTGRRRNPIGTRGGLVQEGRRGAGGGGGRSP